MANQVKKRPVIFRLVMKDGSVWEVTKPWLHPEGGKCDQVDTVVTGIFRFDEVPRREQENEAGELVDFQPGRPEHFLIFGLPLKPVECQPDDPEALRVKMGTNGEATTLVFPRPEYQALPVFVDGKGVGRKMGPFGKNDEGSIAEISPEEVERIEFSQSRSILQQEVERLLKEEMGADVTPAPQKSTAAGSGAATSTTAAPSTPAGGGGGSLPKYD
jgi:hypothetical protein